MTPKHGSNYRPLGCKRIFSDMRIHEYAWYMYKYFSIYICICVCSCTCTQTKSFSFVYIWLFALATKQSLPSVFFALQGLGPHPNKASRSRTLAAGVVWWATPVSNLFAAWRTHCIHWHCKMRFRALRTVGNENAHYIYIMYICICTDLYTHCISKEAVAKFGPWFSNKYNYVNLHFP